MPYPSEIASVNAGTIYTFAVNVCVLKSPFWTMLIWLLVSITFSLVLNLKLSQNNFGFQRNFDPQHVHAFILGILTTLVSTGNVFCL
jgi:hypothetical protein